jgi:FkbM family methyltransferase
MKQRAKFLKFSFNGRKNFNLPTTIHISNKDVSLHYPAEQGVFIDFVSIFLEDAYNLDSFKENIKSVLDIGGNLGFFSMATRNKFPNAKIHLYEPNPNLNSYIALNTKTLNIQAYEEAVGNSYENIELTFLGDSNQTRTDFSKNGNVKQIPFSETIKRLGGSVDFAKIDCEGAEWEMIKDPEPWKNIKWLAMEYHLWDGHTDKEIYDILEKLGFTILEQTPMGNYGHIWAINEQYN